MIFLLVVASGVIGVAAGFVLAFSGGFVYAATQKSTRKLRANYVIARKALNGIVLTTQDANARLEAEIALNDILSNDTKD